MTPGTSFFLGNGRYAPARAMLAADLPLGLGTDFNAGSCLTESMQAAVSLAVLRLKQGRRDDALKEFEASFMAGFSHFDKMDQDPDLDGLRKDARFTELVAQYRNAPAR